jgi:hypothetical protein
MKKIISIFTILVSLTLIYGSCTKRGPTGIRGVQVEQGPAGPKGDTGPKGNPGENGGASVIASDWLNVSFQKEDDEWLGVMKDTSITQNFLDKGEIDVFIKKDDKVHPLNYFATGKFYVVQDVKIGEIDVHSSFDASADSFRYVLIPGGKKISKARMADKSLLDSYDAFCKYYGIRK